MERRLAAILFADVAGYTRLMDEYEADTHARLMALFEEVIEPSVASAASRIVKNTGDGFLACFESVSALLSAPLRFRARSTVAKPISHPKDASVSAWGCMSATSWWKRTTSMVPGST